MNEEYFIVSPVPFLQQHKPKAAAASPISIGSAVRTKDGAYLENLVTIGDPLPCLVTRNLVVAKIIFGDEEFDIPQIRIRLFSNLSREEKVELDSDLNGDPALEIREFAEVIIALPSEKPDEMTVHISFRFDEKGISVLARREDTGENLKAEIKTK